MRRQGCDAHGVRHPYHGRVNSPCKRPDWSFILEIMGERDMFDEDDGAGPASCCPDLLPKKEVCSEARLCPLVSLRASTAMAGLMKQPEPRQLLAFSNGELVTRS